MRRRLKTRDRCASGVVVRCECRKRLADLDADDYLGHNGVWFVHHERAVPMDKFSGGDDDEYLLPEEWFRVVCPRCGSDERGRTVHLDRLIARAIACGRKSVMLSEIRSA